MCLFLLDNVAKGDPDKPLTELTVFLLGNVALGWMPMQSPIIGGFSSQL